MIPLERSAIDVGDRIALERVVTTSGNDINALLKIIHSSCVRVPRFVARGHLFEG